MKTKEELLAKHVRSFPERHNIYALMEEYASQFRPRPYSLDPNSKEYEYKVPEVGEKIDLYEVDKEKLTIIEWLDVYMVDAEAGYYKGYLWLPSRTKDDFKQ